MLFTIEVKGIEGLRDKLNRFGSSLFDLTDIMTEVGIEISEFARDQVFASRGEAIGEPWAPLAASTVAYKEKYGYRGKPDMVRSGHMQDSFYFTPTPISVRIGNHADYFKYHQSAAARGTKLPRRIMLKLTEQNKVMIKEKLQNEIVKRLKVT